VIENHVSRKPSLTPEVVFSYEVLLYIWLESHVDTMTETFNAFWRQEGAYGTKLQEYLDWNKELIKLMVHDIEPHDLDFQAECTTAFQSLGSSTQQALLEFPERLEGLIETKDTVQYR